MSTADSLKDSLISSFSDLSTVEEITCLGRNYQKVDASSVVSDIDLHILVDKKNEKNCDKLVSICQKILSLKPLNSDMEFQFGIYDGPYKPSPSSNKPVCFFHLIVDDRESLFKRSQISYPTIVSWSKYLSINKKSIFLEYMDRNINYQDVTESRYGTKRCAEIIRNGKVLIPHFDIKSKLIRPKEIRLEGYFKFYFLFYATMQSIRNFLRSESHDIEFISEYDTIDILFSNYKFSSGLDVHKLLQELDSIRKTGLTASRSIDNLQFSVLTLLGNLELNMNKVYA